MNVIKNIFIEETEKTPHIDFNQHTGELILSGKSIPENAAKIYEPLMLWTNAYIKSPCHITNLRLNLEYFNTATSLWLAKIVKTLSKIKLEDSVLFIHIYFDIEDFDTMDIEDLKDVVGSLVDNIGDINVSIGVKTYGIDVNGKTVRESTILI